MAITEALDPDAPVDHPLPEERVATGRAARRAVPRSSHGVWEPSATRAHPGDLLAAQETTRVTELVPLRHERMLVSPFTFYRGAAVIMAADLARSRNSVCSVQASVTRTCQFRWIRLA